MSRLNATIKLAVMLGNLVFVLLSAGIAIVSVLVLTGRFSIFSYEQAMGSALAALVASTIVLVFTLYGCCGVVNQVLRSGICAGRKVLCTYQILLVSLLIYCSMQSVSLGHQQKSLELVMSEPSSFPQYDKFEMKVSDSFNEAYFEAVCSERPYESWIMTFVNENCPETMHQDKCFLNGRKRYKCDTTCDVQPWVPQKCCPSRELCSEGFSYICPYFQCRFNVLTNILKVMSPIIFWAQLVSWLSGIMIGLMFLLICYNPRDNVESELLKTGVMTETDIAQVKLRRASENEKTSLIGQRKVSKNTSRQRNSERGSCISVESDSIGRHARRSSSGSSRFAARSCRVSPDTVPLSHVV